MAIPALSHGSKILWHVDLLLRKDHEISSYTMDITRQQTINSNRLTAFSVWTVLRCYKQDKLGVSQLLR
jgi:hypothetical protein